MGHRSLAGLAPNNKNKIFFNPFCQSTSDFPANATLSTSFSALSTTAKGGKQKSLCEKRKKSVAYCTNRCAFSSPRYSTQFGQQKLFLSTQLELASRLHSNDCVVRNRMHASVAYFFNADFFLPTVLNGSAQLLQTYKRKKERFTTQHWTGAYQAVLAGHQVGHDTPAGLTVLGLIGINNNGF